MDADHPVRIHRVPVKRSGSGTGAGTRKDREKPIEIRGKYRAEWREFSDPPGTGYTKSRYFLLRVRPSDC